MGKKLGNDIGHGSDTWDLHHGKGVKVDDVVYEEHSFNARVGQALSRHLKRHGISEVRGQEPNKPDVALTTRTNKYNAADVDAVLSNHANANRNPSVKGICVFAWHDHPESQRLQKLLVEEYEKLGFETHGTGEHESEVGSWTDLHIVRETKMTACLIENGFMTNPDDFKKIFLNSDYAEKCALAQIKALCRFWNIAFIPEVTDGWKKENGKWFYYVDGSLKKNDWVKYKGSWYFLKSNGEMAASYWIKWKNEWYFLDDKGVMIEGDWVKWKNKWYYLKEDGAMKTGYIQYKNKWYFLDGSGAMANSTEVSVPVDKDGALLLK
jgi:N-acetylmuramoyl-L-alanine amidase